MSADYAALLREVQALRREVAELRELIIQRLPVS